MEPYEKLKNLPDTEKAKCFEVLLESIKLVSDDSGDPEKKIDKRLSLNTILNLAVEHNVSSEGSSRKKQKTLDSWLIKPKDASLNKTGESSCILEESTNQRLSSDVNNASECLVQPTANNLNINLSEKNENPSNNQEQTARIHNSPVKNVCISGIVTENKQFTSKRRNTKSSQLSKSNNLNINLSEKNEKSPNNQKQCARIQNRPVKNVCISGIVTEENQLRPKRRNTEPSQLSKSKGRAKSSVFADDIDLNKSNTKLINSCTDNKCNINHDVSPEAIISNCNSDLVDKNDCQEINNLNSLTKVTKNRRLRRKTLNLRDVVQSNTKLNNLMVNKDLDIVEKAVSSESNDTTNSSSLSNWEAFHILQAECARANLNIVDILQDKNVKAVLNDPKKLDNEAVLFIKAFKSNNGKTLPVVHLVDSIKKLCETLKKIKDLSESTIS